MAATDGGSDGWYYEVEGTEHGPVPSALLKRMADLGKIAPDTRVRRQGDSRWATARSVRGLFDGGGSRPATPLPSRENDSPTPAAGWRLSEWGLASVLIGCTMLLAQSGFGPRLMLFEVRKSLTAILILAAGELLLLGGAGFGLGAGIAGWASAQRTGNGRAMPMAGVIVSSIALAGWLLQVIAIIRAIDADK